MSMDKKQPRGYIRIYIIESLNECTHFPFILEFAFQFSFKYISDIQIAIYKFMVRLGKIHSSSEHALSTGLLASTSALKVDDSSSLRRPSMSSRRPSRCRPSYTDEYALSGDQRECVSSAGEAIRDPWDSTTVKRTTSSKHRHSMDSSDCRQISEYRQTTEPLEYGSSRNLADSKSGRKFSDSSTTREKLDYNKISREPEEERIIMRKTSGNTLSSDFRPSKSSPIESRPTRGSMKKTKHVIEPPPASSDGDFQHHQRNSQVRT
jgi:hypothetical protein